MKRYIISTQSPNWASYSSSQKSKTYDAVKAAGDAGITREEICSQTGLPKQRVWFYLSELRRGGQIKRMGDAVDPASLSPLDAKLHALVALENAVVIEATAYAQTHQGKMDPTVVKQFERYNKIKALALGAKTGPEEKAALRRAVLDLVTMVF